MNDLKKAQRRYGVIPDDHSLVELSYSDFDNQFHGLKGQPQTLKKYIAAQRLAARVYGYEASSEVLRKPNDLYRTMRKIGFVWDTETNKRSPFWRLRRDKYGLHTRIR